MNDANKKFADGIAAAKALAEPKTKEEKVEFLKVWYALFCTLMDGHGEGEFSDSEVAAKLRQLRNALVTRMPEVEAGLLDKRT